ncbi:MAG: hypothetical protein IPI75_17150 [Gammaproteobacteria bacterium]|nr:hypothetical protein [Gammaproteobacteria bacterium]
MAVLPELRFQQRDDPRRRKYQRSTSGRTGIVPFTALGWLPITISNRPLPEPEAQQIALLVALVRWPRITIRDAIRACARAPQPGIPAPGQPGRGNRGCAGKLDSGPRLGVDDRERSRSKIYPAYFRTWCAASCAPTTATTRSQPRGLQAFTGLDLAAACAAERSLQDTLAAIERDFAARGKPQKGPGGRWW